MRNIRNRRKAQERWDKVSFLTYLQITQKKRVFCCWLNLFCTILTEEIMVEVVSLTSYIYSQIVEKIRDVYMGT